MKELLAQARKCNLCSDLLEPRPVLSASEKSRIVIIGQAPGAKVHQSGIPWDDPSGRQLRSWLGVDEETFYNPDYFAIIPMGFCYPGKGSSGDLPPSTICAPTWHAQILEKIPQKQLTLLIGQYAQNFYLKAKTKNLTETVRDYKNHLPEFLPLPHPSPRNRFWMAKNKWFEKEVIPELKSRVLRVLEN